MVKFIPMRIVFILVSMADLVYSCPRDCKCYPSIVTCKNRLFQEEMFNAIPRDTKQLYLSNCNISFSIGPKTFKNFTQLEYLYLDNEPYPTSNLWNKITYIGAGTFAHLKRLRLLSLRNIQLKSIHSNTFQGLTQLQILTLENNHLIVIPKYSFKDLNNLQELFLGDNRLQVINNDMVKGLESVKQFNLSNNYIGTIDGIHSMTSIQELYLSGNKMAIIKADLFQGLVDLRDLTLNDNQLTTIENGALNSLQRISLIEIKKNANLQCNCDVLSFIWNHIHTGKIAEIQCSRNGDKINTENNKQMNDQDVANVNCKKSTNWMSWSAPEDCKNYHRITRRTCIANFTIPKCNGTSIKVDFCVPLTYANYSKASGVISFYNPREYGENVGIVSLNEAMGRDKENFLSKLSLSMKYLLYAGHGFTIKSVDILDIKLIPVTPPVKVQYEITMERTSKSIWNINPVSGKKAITFGEFELETDPSFSTIKDYDECEIDNPCDRHADCIVVKENFNFGCQCRDDMRGDGFYCYMVKKEEKSKIEGPSEEKISIAAVACIIIGLWAIIIVCIIIIRYRAKRQTSKQETKQLSKEAIEEDKRKYMKIQRPATSKRPTTSRRPATSRRQQRQRQQQSQLQVQEGYRYHHQHQQQQSQHKQQQPQQELKDMVADESNTDYGAIGQDNQGFQFTSF